MANCLYNDIKLPEIPASILESNPYAIIVQSDTEGTLLCLAQETWIYNINYETYDVGTGYYRQKYKNVNSTWGFITQFGTGLNSETYHLIWANHDIMTNTESRDYANSTLYFAASEPQPIPSSYTDVQTSFLKAREFAFTMRANRHNVTDPWITLASYEGVLIRKYLASKRIELRIEAALESKPPYDQYSDLITDLYIYNGITDLFSSGASQFVNLKTTTLPSSLSSIPSAFFKECTSLYSISIPPNVTTISTSAFQNSGLRSIAFNGENLKNIESKAFSGTDLTNEIILPNSLIEIHSDAFSNISAFPHIFIPASVTSIPNSICEQSDNLSFYCEASEKPEGWNDNWNTTFAAFGLKAPVTWGVSLEDFKQKIRSL